MEPFNNCRFCNIVVGKYQYAEIDQPFASSDAFVAMASIGALIEGWSLIIPKEHQLSMRNVYDKPEFADFVGTVISLLVKQYGSLIAFEHGSNKEGSITACGTDHAHLHLVPYCESLFSDLQSSGLQWVQCQASEIASRVGNSEYLFYSELGVKNVWHDPVGYFHVLEHPISQFFRHLIAARTGHAETSDYRRFLYLDAARQTRRTLVESTV